jgi:hypothetical protein
MVGLVKALEGKFGIQGPDGSWLLKLDLDTGEVEFNGDMDQVAAAFWKAIDAYTKGSKNVVIIRHNNKDLIEIDPERRAIMHDLWNPMASYVLSELEKRG